MLRNSTPYRVRQKKGEEKRIVLILTFFVIGLLGVSLTVYGMYRVLCKTALFMVTETDIVGADRITQKEILALCDLKLQTNLLTVSPARLQKRVEAHPWIAWAEIKRQWPNRLLVRIKERQPVAIANVEGKLFFVDAKGIVFTEVNPDADLDFPVISGLGRSDLDIQNPSGALQCALQFLRYVPKNDSVLPRQNISEINIRQGGDLVVFLADRPFPIYLGSEAMERKHYRLVKVLGWLYKKKEFEITEYIRLDYGSDKVLVGKTS